MIKSKNKLILLLLVMILAMSMLATACGGDEKKEEDTAKVEPKGTIVLATTTSTKDSGLLDYLLPTFKKETGYEVDVISVGSGEAMAMGEAGEADVLLVHSPKDEEAFVKAGHADSDGRLDVMYNDFVLVGPKEDPSKVKENASADAVKAFTAIYDNKSTFVSRGDESGTHKKELSIWEGAKLTPKGDWYVEAADGMGAVITMADEMNGYTLADRATWLNVGKETGLQIVSEKDPSGVYDNPYGVICVNPEKNENINTEGAKTFQEWIVSPETQKLIGEFGIKEYGESLFVPDAK
jgi:tungstate transport system substrate-binding protein